MTQEEQCQELMMQDVVRIDFMPTNAIKVGIPFNVQNITETTVTMADDAALTDIGLYTDSMLSVNLAFDPTVDAEMKEGLSHKVTEKRDVAGIVRTHTLQIPIELGFHTIREQQKALQQNDFHIILTTYGGERYLAYALPNTCQFNIEDQMGQTAQMNLKAVVQSMSGFIRIQA